MNQIEGRPEYRGGLSRSRECRRAWFPAWL